MKTRTLIALLAASSLGTAFGQTTAFTDPVGYFEVTLSGTFNFVSSGTSNAEKYQGVPTSTTATTVTDTGAFVAMEFDKRPLTDGVQYPTHYIEIARTLADHPAEGARIDIDSNTADTITLIDVPAGSAAAFTGMIDSTASVIVRKHRTISDIFGGAAGGSAPADLQIDSGGDPGSADQVQLFVGGAYTAPIFYLATMFGGGWSGAPDAANLPIQPGTGLVVVDNNLSSNTIVQDGHVKVTRTLFRLVDGLNLICSPVALDRLYSDMFGGSAGGSAPADLVLTSGADAGLADNIITFGITTPGVFDPPSFYLATMFGGGWDPADNSIPFTDSFFVEVKSGNGPIDFGVDFFDEDAGVAIP